MIDGEKHFYLIEWSYTDGDKTITGVNHYMTNIIDIDYDEYMGYIKKAGFDSLRLYLSGTNLLTISGFDLWDIEMGGNGLGYPIQRTYNIGVQLNF